jgi:hypothetical protein
MLAAASGTVVFWLMTRESEGADRATVVSADPAPTPAAPPAPAPDPSAGATPTTPEPAAPEPVPAAKAAAPPAEEPTAEPSAAGATPAPAQDAAAEPAAEEPAAEGAADAAADPGAASPEPEPEEQEAEPAVPEDPPDVARLRQRFAAGDRRGSVRQLERLRAREPRRAEIYYALGNLYAELNAWKPSVEAYGNALSIEDGYRDDMRLISDVVEALASDLAHGRAATIIRKELGSRAVPRLEQAMRSASPRQRVRARRLRSRLR